MSQHVTHSPAVRAELRRNRGPLGADTVRRRALAPGEPWDTRKVVRRTGLRFRDEARASRGDLASLGGLGDRLGTGDTAGAIGNGLMVALGSLLGLVLLELLLSKGGSSIVSAATSWSGQTIGRLISPTDTLIGTGTTASVNTAAAAQARAASALITAQATSIAATRPTAGIAPPSGRLVPAPASPNGSMIDASYAGLVGYITHAFGVQVSSGARSVVDNTRVGGAPNSDHLTGNAADFTGTPANLARLYHWALGDKLGYVEPLTQSRDHVHISFWRPTAPNP